MGVQATGWTDAQSVQCRKIFQMYDVRKEGKILISEVGKILRAMGLNPTNKEIQRLVAGHKANDKVDLHFLLQVGPKFARDKPVVTETQVVECLAQYDKGGKGTIPSTDLKSLLTDMGEKLTESEVDEVLQGLGPNVNLEAFAKMLFDDSKTKNESEILDDTGFDDIDD